LRSWRLQTIISRRQACAAGVSARRSAGIRLVAQRLRIGKVGRHQKLRHLQRLLVSGLASSAIATTAMAQSTTNNDVSGSVEEVLVTAQRRLESSQDVPISIDTVKAERLVAVGVQALPQLNVVTPGLQFQRAGATTSPFLRGVGAQTSTAGSESAVALFVDGVYIAAQGASLMSLSNVESVEVDKGPQGTLFGRNATGGVIQITTRKPSHDPHADITLGYGNYNTVDATSYATGGVSGDVAADLALSVHEQLDGYGTNLFTGRPIYRNRDYTARTKWLFTPSDDTEVTLILDYEQLFDERGFATRLPRLGELGLDQRGRGGFRFSGGFYDVDLDSPGFNRTTTWGGSVNAVHDFGFAQLRSISALHEQHWLGKTDLDLTPNNGTVDVFNPHQDTLSQEFQLLSADNEQSWLKWVAGSYLYHDLSKYDPTYISYAPGPLSNTTIYGTLLTNSWAVFGQGTIRLAAKTHLTLGIRYTEDRRSVNDIQTSVGPVPGGLVQKGDASFPKLTYRAALDHRFSDELMGYIQTSTGFKSGFFNNQALQSVPGQPKTPLAIEPESLDAYEMGLKSDLLGRRLRVNVSGFYYKYDNEQVNAFLGPVRILLNAANAKIHGADLEVQAAATQRLSFSFNGEYLSAHYTSFPAAPRFIATPAPGIGNTAVPFNASNFRMIDAPVFAGTLAGDYTIPFASSVLVLDTNLYYNSGYYFDFANTRKQRGYPWLNASAKFVAPGGKWDLTLWGKNLTGEEVIAGDGPIGTGPAGLFGGDSIAPSEPRTFGVRVGAHF
jgi:iron complex outermembrane recepter protein